MNDIQPENPNSISNQRLGKAALVAVLKEHIPNIEENHITIIPSSNECKVFIRGLDAETDSRLANLIALALDDSLSTHSTQWSTTKPTDDQRITDERKDVCFSVSASAEDIANLESAKFRNSFYSTDYERSNLPNRRMGAKSRTRESINSGLYNGR